MLKKVVDSFTQRAEGGLLTLGPCLFHEWCKTFPGSVTKVSECDLVTADITSLDRTCTALIHPDHFSEEITNKSAESVFKRSYSLLEIILFKPCTEKAL